MAHCTDHGGEELLVKTYLCAHPLASAVRALGSREAGQPWPTHDSVAQCCVRQGKSLPHLNNADNNSTHLLLLMREAGVLKCKGD